MAKDLKLKLKIDAEGNVTGFAKSIKKEFDGASKSVDNASKKTDQMSKSLKRLRNEAIGAFSAYKLMQYTNASISLADSYKSMTGQIKLVTESENELLAVRSRLHQISTEARSDLLSMTKLYSAMSPTLKIMGKDAEASLEIIETYNKALALTSPTAMESASATLQFAQALGSGVLRGEEFNSIMENGRGVAMTLADGLGVPIGALRSMAEQGQLTADVVISALESQADVIDQKFLNIELTVSQAMQVASNHTMMWLGSMNETVDVTGTLAEGIIFMSQSLDEVAIVSIAALAGAVGSKAVPAMWSMVAATNAQNLSMARLVTTTRAATIATLAFAKTPFGAAITAGAAALSYFVLSSEDAVETSDELINRLDLMKQGFDNLSKAQLKQALVEVETQMDKMRAKVFSNADKSLLDVLFGDADEAKKEHQQLWAAWNKLIETKQVLKDKLDQVGDASSRVGVAFADSTKEIVHWGQMLNEQIAEFSELTTFDQEMNKITEEHIKLLHSESEAEEMLFQRRLMTLDLTREQVEQLMAKYREYAELKASVEAEEQAAKQEKELLKKRTREFERMAERIDDVFVDVWSGVIDGSDNAFDAIGRMFNQLLAEMAHAALTRPIMINAMGYVGLAPQSQGGGFGSQSGSIFDQGMNAYSNINSIGTIASYLDAGIGFAGLAGSLGYGGVAAGSQAAMLAAQTSSFGSAGASLTAAASGGTAGLAGTMAAAAPYIAAALVIDNLTGGGITTGLFGGSWKLHDAGIDILANSSGVDANNYKVEGRDGGWFRRSEWRSSSVDLPEVEAAFSDVVVAMMGAVSSNSEKLGFSFDESYSQFNRISLKGKSEAETQQLIQDWVTGFGESLVESVYGLSGYLSQFTLESETSIDTLSRVVSQYETFNGTLRYVNQAIGDLSQDSIAAVDNLVRLSGGLQALTNNQNTYYQAFFTDAEKFADLQGDLAAALGVVNYSLPQTRDGYRALVEGLDLSNEADQERYTLLMSLSGVADNYYRQLLTQEQDVNQMRLDAIEDQQRALTGLSDTLDDAYSDILGTVKATTAADYMNAQGVLSSALSIAQTGGVLDVDAIESAIDVVSRNSADNYATRADFTHDQLVTANLINSLNGYLDSGSNTLTLKAPESGSALSIDDFDSASVVESNRLQNDMLQELKQIRQILEKINGDTAQSRVILDAVASHNYNMVGQLNMFNRFGIQVPAV